MDPSNMNKNKNKSNKKKNNSSMGVLERLDLQIKKGIEDSKLLHPGPLLKANDLNPNPNNSYMKNKHIYECMPHKELIQYNQQLSKLFEQIQYKRKFENFKSNYRLNCDKIREERIMNDNLTSIFIYKIDNTTKNIRQCFREGDPSNRLWPKRTMNYIRPEFLTCIL